MAPETTSPPARAGMKRPHSSSTASGQQSHKKQRTRHALFHLQNRPANVEPAPQDPVYAQGQLLKSISAALMMVGYDSVKPSALEMLRSHVEEYILQFLEHARASMLGSRRTRPTALDFASALARTPNASTASLLKDQLKLRTPPEVSYPSIPEPDPVSPAAPDFSNLLAPLMPQSPRKWIPKHFPSLPPSHAWESTPVFPEREQDARKMREKATEEGKLAEQALRKLAAAAKTSAMNAEKRRYSALSGQGKTRGTSKSRRTGVRVQGDSFADVLRDIGGSDEATDLGLGLDRPVETEKDSMDLGMPEGVAVNHSMSYWRKSASRRI